MSETVTSPLGLSPEDQARLCWPGVNLADCEVLHSGSIVSVDRASNKIDYERPEKVDGQTQWVCGVLRYAGVGVEIKFHPPLTTDYPLDTDQEFWHVVNLANGAEAILRVCEVDL